MQHVTLRTVRNLLNGKEDTVSSSEAKRRIRTGEWIPVAPRPAKHQELVQAPRKRGFWRKLFGL